MMQQKQMAEFKALAKQLTLEQQCAASADALDYYQECRCDGMRHAEAQEAAEKHHMHAVRAMVNDKVLTELGL